MEGSSVERAFSLWLNDGVCSMFADCTSFWTLSIHTMDENSNITLFLYVSHYIVVKNVFFFKYIF